MDRSYRAADAGDPLQIARRGLPENAPTYHLSGSPARFYCRFRRALCWRVSGRGLHVHGRRSRRLLDFHLLDFHRGAGGDRIQSRPASRLDRRGTHHKYLLLRHARHSRKTDFLYLNLPRGVLVPNRWASRAPRASECRLGDETTGASLTFHWRRRHMTTFICCTIARTGRLRPPFLVGAWPVGSGREGKFSPFDARLPHDGSLDRRRAGNRLEKSWFTEDARAQLTRSSKHFLR